MKRAVIGVAGVLAALLPFPLRSGKAVPGIAVALLLTGVLAESPGSGATGRRREQDAGGAVDL